MPSMVIWEFETGRISIGLMERLRWVKPSVPGRKLWETEIYVLMLLPAIGSDGTVYYWITMR